MIDRYTQQQEIYSILYKSNGHAVDTGCKTRFPDMTINNHHHEKQVTSPMLNCYQAACTVECAHQTHLLSSATSNSMTQLKQWWLLHAKQDQRLVMPAASTYKDKGKAL